MYKRFKVEVEEVTLVPGHPKLRYVTLSVNGKLYKYAAKKELIAMINFNPTGKAFAHFKGHAHLLEGGKGQPETTVKKSKPEPEPINMRIKKDRVFIEMSQQEKENLKEFLGHLSANDILNLGGKMTRKHVATCEKLYYSLHFEK